MTILTGKQKFDKYKEGSKMYAAEIMSTPYLADGRFALSGEGSFHMILTHIVQKDANYTEYYAKEKGLKLLDNSLFELGYALPPEDVITAAALVDADILVAPDVIRDGPQTQRNAVEFIEQLRGLGTLGEYAIMAVPQGNTIEEWVECYQVLSSIDEIDCIGLSIIGMITAMQDTTGTEDIVANRKAFMQHMSRQGLWNDDKWHHLLGLGRGPFELEFYESMNFVRSNDSSNAWWHGYNGVKYNHKGKLQEKLKLEVDFNAPITPERSNAIAHNLVKQRSIIADINEKRGVE